MWIADNWKDYEVLDTSAGEKLERWGDYILVRPDPQVIWNTPHEHTGWKHKNGHYHRSSKGGGEWEFFDLPDEWTISYETGGRNSAPWHGRLTFRLKPFSFKHTGLFPEQAVNWDWISDLIRSAAPAADRPVNLVDFSVLEDDPADGQVAQAENSTARNLTSGRQTDGELDYDPYYIEQERLLNEQAEKENAQASGLGDAPIRWLVDDCVKFVEREIRRGNKYDGIIMDPPSYGRGPKGEIWKIEEGIWPFMELTAQLLSKDALFFLINSYTTGLQPAVLSYMVNLAVTKRFGGSAEADEIGLPVSESGLILPCGASGRWHR